MTTPGPTPETLDCPVGQVVAPSPTRVRSFAGHLSSLGLPPLRRSQVTTLQVNLGKLCNQACLHCHVEAGPKRTEILSLSVAQRVLELLEKSPQIQVVDLTGGAPELNPHFRWIVEGARALGREVIDRCNLTVFFEPGMEDLPAFLAKHQVRVTASLPCYTADNVDAQRGQGVFDKSLRALAMLNDLGYGTPGSGLELDLVFNPAGASLPPPQAALEQSYRQELHEQFGLSFNRLLTLTNLPVKRFAESLARDGQFEQYMQLLVENFNPDTVEGLMCRGLISVAWDGALYDCDFNQMLEIPANAGGTDRATVFSIESFDDLEGSTIPTAGHCFGCTAGAGSSCGGALQ